MNSKLAALVLFTATLSIAQQTGITERITDPSNASIATAIVSAKGEDGTRQQTIANAQGIYQFPTMRAAKYVLRVEAPGFGPAERTLSLLVGQVASVDIALQVAAATSSVAVEAAADAIDTATSMLAGTASPSEVSKVPLNGRNYLQLALLVPGITSNAVSQLPTGCH